MSNKHHFKGSSSIKHIDYHNDTKELEVCFASGGTHCYEAPREVYEAMKKAESAGSHFHQHVRRAGFKSRKLD